MLHEHHNVTIFERSSGNHEIGAAIALRPTATKIVEQYGVDRKQVGALACRGSRAFNKNGKLEMPVDLRLFARNTNADLLLTHRVNLRNEFLGLATVP